MNLFLSYTILLEQLPAEFEYYPCEFVSVMDIEYFSLCNLMFSLDQHF